jgi:3-hydroxybutyryl-CoA dehydrogenase
VIVLDRDEAALDCGRVAVAKGATALIERGNISQNDAEALHARILWTLNIGDLAGAGVVIEAIVEAAEAKRSLYQSLEEVISSAALIATNTSSLSVSSLASALACKNRFLGLHFFNPAPVMKLVEVVAGDATDAKHVETALTLMSQWGKVAVKVRDVPGFIVNRVARPFYGEGWRALEEGVADAATLDFLYRDIAGFRMGPFELGDLIGHDINSAAANTVYEAYAGRTRFRPSALQSELAAEGRFGRKTGRGVFDYAKGVTRLEPAFAPRTKPALGQGDLSSGVEINGAIVAFCNGKSARARAKDTGQPFAALDWMRNPEAASAIAFAASDDVAREAALSLAAAMDKKAVEISDRPGLVVYRTLAQLANCAADAVQDGVAEADAIDTAMMNGVNYPFGPLAWARAYGFDELCLALDHIAEETGDEMYSPSQFLRLH